MLLIHLLLIGVGVAAAVVCWVRGQRTTAVVLGGFGFATLVVAAVGVAAASPLPGNIATLAYAIVAVIVAARTHASADGGESGSQAAGRGRRTALGALLGVLPGALIIGLAVLLLELDVITSDQSQFAFIGVPLAVVGLLAGALIGATYSPGKPGREHAPDEFAPR